MGIYDRDYYQESERRLSFSAPRTMVTTLILINVAVYILDFVSGYRLSEWGRLWSDLFSRPWEAWNLVSAGFLHDKGIFHVGLNMFALWIFGREVESLYGRWELLRMYLAFLVLSSLGWVVAENLWGAGPPRSMVGASGAITGILVVFVMNFPRQVFYIWGVIPMPAWLFATLFILLDLLGFLSGPSAGVGGPRTAFAAHLSGALCGFVYFRSGTNLGRLFPGGLKIPSFRGSRLRLHDPEQDERKLNQEVDAILEKIHRQGEASLSKKERRILESASRRFQQRRR